MNQEFAKIYRRSSKMDKGSWSHIKKVFDGRLLVQGPGMTLSEELITGKGGGRKEKEKEREREMLQAHGHGMTFANQSEEARRVQQWREYNNKNIYDGFGSWGEDDDDDDYNYILEKNIHNNSSPGLAMSYRSISPTTASHANHNEFQEKDNSTRPMHKIDASYTFDYGTEDCHHDPNGVGGHVMRGDRNPYVDRLRTRSKEEFGTWKDSYATQHGNLTKNLQDQLESLKEAENSNRAEMRNLRV
tara:strand:- start:18 stop:752 length:735 start_codon:yes stop_codon:yes gene_type:complete